MYFFDSEHFEDSVEWGLQTSLPNDSDDDYDSDDDDDGDGNNQNSNCCGNISSFKIARMARYGMRRLVFFSSVGGEDPTN